MLPEIGFRRLADVSATCSLGLLLTPLLKCRHVALAACVEA
jgi:hypothetical protein